MAWGADEILSEAASGAGRVKIGEGFETLRIEHSRGSEIAANLAVVLVAEICCGAQS